MTVSAPRSGLSPVTRRSVPIAGLLAVVAWGASFVATRVALRYLGPFDLVGVRLAMGTLLLAAITHYSGRRLAPQRRDIPASIVLGLVLAAHLAIQASGLLLTTAIHAGWIIGFIPVTIALGSHLLRQQRLNRVGWAGVALGTLGVLAVTMTRPPDFSRAHWGDGLQIASCLTWTVYTLVAVGPIARNGVLCITTFSMAVATLACGTAAAFVTTPDHLPAVEGLVAIVFLGLICNGLAYYLWFAAVRTYGPARTGALLYVEPFVTLAAAAAYLREPVTLSALAGGIGVLAGVWLVSRGTLRPAAVQEPQQPPGAEPAE